jgi:preprotein translocase subunit YajC
MNFLKKTIAMALLTVNAFADAAAGGLGSSNPMQGIFSMLPMIILLVLFMYLTVIRPQSKKAKEHKNLMSNLQKGDEIVTIAGIYGKIEKITDEMIVVTIAEHTNITIQKGAVANIVPKGTIKFTQ